MENSRDNNKDTRSNRDKFFSYGSFLVLGVAFALTMLVLFWSLQSDNVFTVKDHKITPLQTKVVAGEVIPIRFSFCKLIDVDGKVTRSFVSNATVLATPTTLDQIGETCINDLVIKVPVPPQAGTGEYRIRYEGEYRINPIKTAKVEFYSEPFEIVARDPSLPVEPMQPADRQR